MTYDPNIHHRRSIRLRGYDYRQAGAYFVTICAHGRECLFGDIVSGTMQLNPYGAIVVDWWNAIPEHFNNVDLDAFVVMPNHIHGIVVLTNSMTSEALNATQKPTVPNKDFTPDVMLALPQRPTLGKVVAYFKYLTTKGINQVRSMPGIPIWQRNYYEQIIRTETSLQQIRQYIANNPLRWESDQLHPDNPPRG
jgi:putative transposase